MAQSPEYPDLLFVPPRSWRNANRPSVQLIVIHTTEGHERATSAEDGAAYDARRTDGTSAHYYHDQNSTVQCVRTEDVAHTARTQGNLRGIQHELCGRAGQTDDQWDDAASRGTLQQAARQCARDAKKWGIPVRRLTVAQVRAGAKGFCGHNDITRAFPADGGDHTDPGPNFPWTAFLAMVRAELEDDVTAKQNWTEPVIPLTESTARRIGGKEGDLRAGATLIQWAIIRSTDGATDAKAARLAAEATLTAVSGDLDEQTILTRIDQVAQQLAKVPDEVADALADADRPAEDTAAALRVVLGDRAVEVGRILAGQA